MTDDSVGDACSVNAGAATGVFAWVESATTTGVYIMVCDTRP
jgi:hypothetical protein